MNGDDRNEVPYVNGVGGTSAKFQIVGFVQYGVVDCTLGRGALPLGL